MIPHTDQLLTLILELQAQIRDAVLSACAAHALEDLAGVAEDDAAGDTIYAVDRVSEELLVTFFAERVAPMWPLILLAEGLPPQGVTLPHGLDPEAALIRVLVDPIDGTRGLMYQKRPAWVLTGVAPNCGPNTRLQDIVLAAQTEIPLVKQHLADVLWATKGGPLHAERLNRLTGERWPITLRPSRATSIAHGFATVSRFFPGVREPLAAVDEALVRAILGPPQRGKAHCFEDQYICSGGQLYELIAGHDRFVADLRPLLEPYLAARGEALGICCHPYDLCTALIAQQAGVILTDAHGAQLDAPLGIEADVGWIGYANRHIQAQVEAPLQAALQAIVF
ncbi:inositol monophosphatase [Candidatus Viridilinea mediisalina]|uniref:Inositol monophosphatase n=1 Tax=Candidatus Viridilinea mediisalina TaxID=2024553 RepID=A0A2A6RJ56_9CHLR|nr:inositol monophosphatase [Candidatus Viridilinea mediisalina]PDW02919.1 inositol monophosphatase [Candidatus Viridilinea mediisalina]